MQIRYQCADTTVDVDGSGSTILDISIAQRIPHLRECGGNGRCTTCRIRILDGLNNVTPMTARELEAARARDWDKNIRLACQTRVQGDITIQCLVRSGTEVSRLQTETIPSETGEERFLAILFCDMRNFTPLVGSRPAFDVVHLLNRYFTALGEPILQNNGLIYQYVGDEITGLFGVDGDTPQSSCLAAVRAGLGMLYALERLNTAISRDFGVKMAVGIGVHFGSTIVGNIGHPERRRFAVVGDAVNVASRIQSVNKQLATTFLISEKVLAQLPEKTLATGKTSSISLKGKSEPFTLFEVLNFSEPDTELLIQSTLSRLLRDEERFADEFYRQLFSVAPETRKLFQESLEKQRRMFTSMLSSILYAMSRPKNLELGLRQLGRRHKGYGVNLGHYPVVRDAFLETVRKELGEECTPQVIQAWEKALDFILSQMSAESS